MNTKILVIRALRARVESERSKFLKLERMYLRKLETLSPEEKLDVLDIPTDKNYPFDSVQCDQCAGIGCWVCKQKGWLEPASNPFGRCCLKCSVPLHPTSTTVYCKGCMK